MDIKAKILLVEDDENLGFVTKDGLEMEGFKVDWGKDGEEGFDLFCNGDYDLCILDVMMPKKDGFSLAKDIRVKNDSVPIIFLTAKSLDEDKIKGFKTGADDYVTKPFNIDLLVLRAKALLKRFFTTESNAHNEKDKFEIGALTFDYKNHVLTGTNYEQKLTRKEADMLRLLCLNKNDVLSRELALKMIWGENDYFKGRSMDVFVTKLRKYLKEDPKIEIQNIHGTGFKLVD